MWRTIPAQENIPSYASLAIPLQKSEQDDREYRLIQLENGLQAIIVHEKLADKAAACLQVAVGHLQDPVAALPPCYMTRVKKLSFQTDMPGLAHFCEHMVSKVIIFQSCLCTALNYMSHVLRAPGLSQQRMTSYQRVLTYLNSLRINLRLSVVYFFKRRIQECKHRPSVHKLLVLRRLHHPRQRPASFGCIFSLTSFYPICYNS